MYCIMAMNEWVFEGMQNILGHGILLQVGEYEGGNFIVPTEIPSRKRVTDQ